MKKYFELLIAVRSRWILCYFCLWGMAVTSAMAQTVSTELDRSATIAMSEQTMNEDAAAEQKTGQPLTDEEINKRKNMLSVSWILLLGICLLGGLLFVFVLVLGASAKRIARHVSPDASLNQPYWYLKNPADPAAKDQGKPEADEHA